MTNDQPPINQQIVNIESRLERLEGEFREQSGVLLDGLIALSQQTTTLANRVDGLTDTMIVFARNAEADRAVMREMRDDMRQMQAEIQQIWQYLLSQRPNGQQG